MGRTTLRPGTSRVGDKVPVRREVRSAGSRSQLGRERDELRANCARLQARIGRRVKSGEHTPSAARCLAEESLKEWRAGENAVSMRVTSKVREELTLLAKLEEELGAEDTLRGCLETDERTSQATTDVSDESTVRTRGGQPEQQQQQERRVRFSEAQDQILGYADPRVDRTCAPPSHPTPIELLQIRADRVFPPADEQHVLLEPASVAAPRGGPESGTPGRAASAASAMPSTAPLRHRPGLRFDPTGGFLFGDPCPSAGLEPSPATSEGVADLASTLAALFREHTQSEAVRLRALLAQERSEHLERLAAQRAEHLEHLDLLQQRHLEQLGVMLGVGSEPEPGPSVSTESGHLDAAAPAYEPSSRPSTASLDPPTAAGSESINDEQSVESDDDLDVAPPLVPGPETQSNDTVPPITPPDTGPPGLSTSASRDAATRVSRPHVQLRVDYDHADYLPWVSAALHLQWWWRSSRRSNSEGAVGQTTENVPEDLPTEDEADDDLGTSTEDSTDEEWSTAPLTSCSGGLDESKVDLEEQGSSGSEYTEGSASDTSTRDGADPCDGVYYLDTDGVYYRERVGGTRAAPGL